VIVIPLILALLPAVPHIVLGIEALFKHGSGASKKQAAMSALGDMLNIASTAAGTPGADSSAMAYVDALVEATVKYFNDTGVMSHSNDTSTTGGN
jgi:hypothetical protein